MRTPVHQIGRDALLVAAARRMRDENVGSLRVGDGGELFNMITDRDMVVSCVAEGENCVKTAVPDAMSAAVSWTSRSRRRRG